MKKIIGFTFIFFIGILFLYYSRWDKKLTTNKEHNIISVTPSSKKENNKKKTVDSVSKSLFIPYWNIPNNENDIHIYKRLIYFGLAIDKDGMIDETDEGYKSIDDFMSLCRENEDKECIITLRMLDSEKNLLILKDKQLQKNIIREVLTYTKKQSIKHIALDFELFSLFNAELPDQINDFVHLIATESKKADIKLSFIIYGDVFYRKRPYDVKTIGSYVDEIMIMAYDFHKSNGEPGPNFPLTRRNPKGEGGQNIDYGYDFLTMIKDFTLVVNTDKITVLFGMYGYDWTMNSQGKPLKRAEAISLKNIHQIITNHKLPALPAGRQITNKSQISNSKEKKVQYKDEEGNDHIIWYEDEESTNVKIEYLKKQGIGRVGYWVWGYF